MYIISKIIKGIIILNKSNSYICYYYLGMNNYMNFFFYTYTNILLKW